MGLCHTKTSPSAWPDLPPDLAGLILRRLPSRAGRLNFEAVCRDWHVTAQQQLPLRGATPWLNLRPGTYQSITDGKVHRFCCGHGSLGSRILCSHGGTPGGERRLLLRNPFRTSVAAVVDIPWPFTEPPKIVFGRSSVAILHNGFCTVAPFCPAGASGPPPRPHPWQPLTGEYADIASYRGKIFAVTRSGELFSGHFSGPRCKYVMSPSVEAMENIVCHLVVSADKKKLLMVRWSIPRQKVMDVAVDDHQHTMDLQVFEADFANGQWWEVKDIGGQVLFVSSSCCKAFGSPKQHHPRFPQGKRVYIFGVDWHRKRVGPGRCCDCRHDVSAGIPSYCVYDMMTGIVSLISLDGGHQLEGFGSEWFFPCE